MPTIRDLALDDAKLLVAKRITQAMGALHTNSSSQEDTFRIQGLGLALAICFEEFTGISARDKRPKELMLWAINLPEPKIRRVQ